MVAAQVGPHTSLVGPPFDSPCERLLAPPLISGMLANRQRPIQYASIPQPCVEARGHCKSLHMDKRLNFMTF